MILFMISEILHLAQVLITLLLVFFDSGGVNTSGQGIGRLALLTFPQINDLFPRQIRGLAKLTSLFTITIILISSRYIGGFFNLKVFLVFGFLFYWLMAVWTISITLLGKEKSLEIHLSLGINGLLNEFLLNGGILVLFIQQGLDGRLEAILKVLDKQFIQKSGSDVEFYQDSLQVFQVSHLIYNIF